MINDLISLIIGIIGNFLIPIIAIIAFFNNFKGLLIGIGFLCLFFDLMGVLAGAAKYPHILLLFYALGYIIVGNWEGILYASIINRTAESAFFIITLIIGIYFSFKDKNDKITN